jgi:chemotaxis-related protein WspB
MLMLLFHIGEELFACDSDLVVEIVPIVKLQKIPHAPPYFSGLLNFGSIPIPVIDLRLLIEEKPCSMMMHTRIVIIKNPVQNSPQDLIGLMVEKMTEIFEEDIKNFLDSGINVKELPFFGGILNRNDYHIQFIDVSQFFNLLKS